MEAAILDHGAAKLANFPGKGYDTTTLSSEDAVKISTLPTTELPYLVVSTIPLATLSTFE